MEFRHAVKYTLHSDAYCHTRIPRLSKTLISPSFSQRAMSHPLCFVLFFISFFTAASSPLVQHSASLRCSAALSGRSVARQQQAWTAAGLRSRWPAICVLPSSAQCLFEQTDAAVNKHYLSGVHVVQPGPLATALNMAAP